MMRRKKANSPISFGGRGDIIFSRLVLSVSMAGILLMIFILGFLAANGLPVLREVPLGEILLGLDWHPAEDPPALGMLPLIAGTLSATLFTSLVSLPISIALAIFTAEIASKRARGFFKVLLELLGFIPSIVLGFLGLMVVAPLASKQPRRRDRAQPSDGFAAYGFFNCAACGVACGRSALLRAG